MGFSLSPKDHPKKKGPLKDTQKVIRTTPLVLTTTITTKQNKKALKCVYTSEPDL
jgi:hypothetical protein